MTDDALESFYCTIDTGQRLRLQAMLLRERTEASGPYLESLDVRLAALHAVLLTREDIPR